MKLTLWFRKLGSALLKGLQRFPAAVLLSMAVTAIILILNHWESSMTTLVREDWTRALAVCIMGFPVVLGVHLMLERTQRPPAYKPAGLPALLAAFVPVAAGLVAYAWFLLPQLEDVEMIRLVMLTAAWVALFVLIPYWWKRDGLALHSTRLLTRGLVTVLYSGILMLALFAILFTLDNLLNVPVKDDHYADTATVVWALFAPLFFMAGIPGVREVPQKSDSPKTLRFLLHYILIPLLWVYTAILYAYSAKILIEREWPRGMVSSLILAYLCVGILVWFLSSPVRDESKLAGFHHRWFPWSALPLFGILVTALFIRINAYGFTEERWFAFILAVWCAGAIAFLAIRSLIRKRDPETAGLRIIWLPLTLALLAISTVVGPVSAFSISIASQNSQFETILTRNNMLADGQATPASGTVSKDDTARIASILYWFEGNHGVDRVTSLSGTTSVGDAAKKLNLTLDGAYPDYRSRYVTLISENQNAPLSITGYDLMADVGYRGEALRDAVSGMDILTDQSALQVTVRQNGSELLVWELEALFDQLVEQYGDGAPVGEVRIPESGMTFEKTVGEVNLRLVLRNIGGEVGDEELYNKGYVEGWLLIDLP